MDLIFFYVFGAVMVVASLFVIGQRNPMYSVLSLILSFGALSGLYVLLNAPFVAVTQIIIYAGAIMVLFLFVVMLLNAHKEGEETTVRAMFGGPGPRRFGAVLSVLLAAQLMWALTRIQPALLGEPAPGIDSVREIGRRLFTDYALAFEATSLLILVAMVGAVVLAGKRTDEGTGQ
ncbi:MAG: NADH-quinone oxidoreductase subunit J [Acidobacteria bacterium]|nr:NADH-quinone oxidoreductase subunit J [Acidobacteriota bacterium]